MVIHVQNQILAHHSQSNQSDVTSEVRKNMKLVINETRLDIQWWSMFCLILYIDIFQNYIK